MIKDEMIWDLSQLVESKDPPSIQKELENMMVESKKIRDTYLGKIKNFEAKDLLELIELNDFFSLNFEGVTMYSSLLYAADSTVDLAKMLNDSTRRALTKVGQTLAFIDIDVGKLLAKNPNLITSPLLAEYKHYLERILKRVPHMLSETEEQLIIIKDKNGVNSWQMLQGDWLSTRTFDIEIDGEIKTLSYGYISGLYQSSNRDLRRRANQVVYETLGKDEILWASAIRAICADHLQMCKIRDYPTPMTPSLIANDVDQNTINNLMQTIEQNVGLYQRYLGLKTKLMGLTKLANYDILAPLPNTPEKDYTWSDSRKEVVSAYAGFDLEFGDWINEMFEKRHIDGAVRKGKRSGAFCSSWLIGKSAYILQSFNGNIGDVYTQAHELGHAIHDYLGSRAQKPSNFEVGSCIAECGSIFGELLLTEQLLSKAKTVEEQQGILTNILDEFGMAAFQVSARVFFEKSLYNAIEQGTFLDGETIAKLWLTAREKIYGDSVDWLKIMKWEWTMKGHYYIANYRFYNYPYVFAQLFVFALYRLYKEQGKAFVPKLKSLLAAGSSKSPCELGENLGFDITSELFWKKGMKQAKEFIEMLEKTL
jgi:oligoendopeptidase F